MSRYSDACGRINDRETVKAALKADRITPEAATKALEALQRWAETEGKGEALREEEESGDE